MDDTATDYLDLRGTMLPDGRIIWEQLGLTSEPDTVHEDQADSPVRAVQLDNSGREIASQGIRMRPFHTPVDSNLTPFPTSRRLEGALPLVPDAHKVDIVVDDVIVTRIGIPEGRPSRSRTLGEPSETPAKSTSTADSDGDLAIRLLHPRAQQRHPLAPVLLEALVFLGEQMVTLADTDIHWFVGPDKVASGRRALWKEPTAGRHHLFVMAQHDGESVLAETHLTIGSKQAHRPLRRTGT